MATNIENSLRRVVPSWREFRLALESGELDPEENRSIPALPADAFLLEKKREWTHNQILLFATDFLGAAYVLGQEELALDAAEFVMDQASGASPAARAIAAKVLRVPITLEDHPKAQSSIDKSNFYGFIRRSKEKRITQPRNAFVWADLSRLYATLGLQEQAKKVMRVAYNLAPSNRYILRSAARLELHLNQPKEAHSLLRKAEITKHDPWLLATEIAICSVLDKTSKLMKIGEGMVESRTHSPFHKSELSSALASVELWNGNIKRAKKLFAISLQKPNDNALAQAVWATRYVPIENLLRPEFFRIRAFEAKTLESFFKGEWKESFEYSKSWFSDEPFSRRPPIHMSFMTSEIFEDYRSSVDITKAALMVVPNEPSLLNNLALALIHLNQLKEAREALSGIDLSRIPVTTKICALATSGLLEYRWGRPKEGQELYLRAIQIASKESMQILKIRAMLYLGREEILTKGSSAAELLGQAVDVAYKSHDRAIQLFASRLVRFKLKN